MLVRFGFPILASLIILAFIAKLIVQIDDPVKIKNDKFYCEKLRCDYEYELVNTTSEQQSGSVVIHIRENDSPQSYKLSDAYIGFKERPFYLKPNESIVVKGKYDSSKKVWLFFRLREN